MDAVSVGQTIATLRRKAGLTQAAVAQRLHISGKTVSKWENGQGFPEVTQFPALAELFGVTVDYLMNAKRRGIVIAGNIVTDIVKSVDCYPQVGMLAHISDVERAIGGCSPNTAVDIARIDPQMPLSIYGRIGDDENGRYVLSQVNRYGIDTTHVAVSSDLPTSFSDVISMPTGERTFFHALGANAAFSPADIDLSTISGVILHIGYILLLEEFDKEDPEFGTVMARFLRDAQARGIKTSIDVVSDSRDAYKQKIVPALKYTDYCIINELEASQLSDLPPYTADGKPDIENIHKTMQQIAAFGVREKVIVHCKQAGFCLDVASDTFSVVPSLSVPTEKIRGSVGAGDAYCAGCLYGIYHQYTDQYMLEFASAVAASSLFAENSTDGVLPKAEIECMMKKYGRMQL